MTPHRLIETDWPEFGAPALPPPLTRAELAERLAAIRAAMAERGLDTLVIYGDREHVGTLRWATGFDPRFEEALLIVPREGPPLLLTGNECLPYAAVSPAVAAGDIRAGLCASLSLISQPRPGETLAAHLAREIPKGAVIGAAGWKYWEAAEVEDPAHALDIPALVADLLRGIGREVVNAGEVFMHPGHGLRTTIDADGIARLEFANHMAASALRRMAFALRPGMRDFEAVEAARIGGLPLGCHVTFAAGGRGRMGLASPSGERVTRGLPISFNVCHWGANICRAGWAAEGPEDLPPEAQGYLEDFVAPYLAAMSAWCALMRPGVAAGEVQRAMDAALPGFGVTLNPGHLIGDDEWVSSPIFPGSELALRSGMAMQCDVIPDHPVYASTRMEDGYVIADDALAGALSRGHPEVMERVRRRQRFMRETVGIEVPDTLLPLADTCGVLAPFLLAPRRIVALG
jgi:Xaa-Pro aminopeptidase